MKPFQQKQKIIPSASAKMELLKRAMMMFSTPFDADATTYLSAITSAGSALSATQRSAVNQLFIALKTANLWNSLVALYPFVGGTSAAHAINAKNPAAYGIAWKGTVTHSAAGIVGDGLTGYGDTGIVPAAVFGASNSSVAMGFYCNAGSLTSATQQDMGARNNDSQVLELQETSSSSWTNRQFGCYSDGQWVSGLNSAADTQGFLVGTTLAPNNSCL